MTAMPITESFSEREAQVWPSRRSRARLGLAQKTLLLWRALELSVLDLEALPPNDEDKQWASLHVSFEITH